MKPSFIKTPIGNFLAHFKDRYLIRLELVNSIEKLFLDQNLQFDCHLIKQPLFLLVVLHLSIIFLPYKLSKPKTIKTFKKKLLDSNGKILSHFLFFDKKTKMLLEYELALTQLLLKFKTYIQTIKYSKHFV